MTKHRFLLLILIAALLGSCGTQPVKPTPEQSDIGTQFTLEQIPTELQRADTLSGEERTLLLLRVARSLIALGELDWARNTLAKMRPDALEDKHFIHHALLSAKVAHMEGDNFLAKRYLWDERLLPLINSAERDTRLYIRELRATLLYNISEYRASVEERLLLESDLRNDDEQRDLNQDLIWQALMAMPIEDLRIESQIQADDTLRGWYKLATISKNNQTNIHQQLREVEQWAAQWPKHPASQRLPADLQLLRQLVEQTPQRIALLLPLSGRLEKAAQALRDGMMAAYYHAKNQEGGHAPVVNLYDTTKDEINLVYDRAVNEGAQLIIGPLHKDNIQKLASRTEISIPTLALNYLEPGGGKGEKPLLQNTAATRDAQGSVEGSALDPQNSEQNAEPSLRKLYQFGLAVEDEARQVAERAYLDGHRRALIVAPKSNFGDRTTAAFSEMFEQLGGKVLHDYRFHRQKEYSNLIKQALQVANSENRARQMREIAGTSLEFTPRRRQDIDLIFLVSYSSEARQLKPTLKFHYAGDIPVYSTSHIYNGKTDIKADRDLNAIRFTTMPWFFDNELPEKLAIAKHTSNAESYQSLYALGVDAYHLIPRLRQLETVMHASFYGSTGTLSLDKQRRIVRRQTWAQFIRGEAFPMPSISLGQRDEAEAVGDQ